MRYLLMLAAAATFAACHNRSEDEVGAAPDRGDTTAVTATDTTSVPTDSTMGQRPGASDSSFVQDTSSTTTTGVDSTNGPTSQGNAPTDTLSQPSGDTTGAAGADTTSSTGTPSDSTMGNMGQDSSDMSMPADSAAQPNQ
jgi:hypothetical protein